MILSSAIIPAPYPEELRTSATKTYVAFILSDALRTVQVGIVFQRREKKTEEAVLGADII
jgi:hypothetical protein